MNKLTWHKIQANYPNEWVALIDYNLDSHSQIEGAVIFHHSNRYVFHEKVSKLLPQYHNIAVRYTGECVKNPEIPLLWQITRTA